MYLVYDVNLKLKNKKADIFFTLLNIALLNHNDASALKINYLFNMKSCAVFFQYKKNIFRDYEQKNIFYLYF